MPEVLRLSEALSHRVLNSYLADEPIPKDQATAPIKAAQLLRDTEVPWPPILEQALHEVVDHARRARAAAEAHEHEDVEGQAGHEGSASLLHSLPVLGRLLGGGKPD
ncbi:hypothetical protein [Methylobacterium dankookense]|uniref:hypothetical protein n=1 Tax=Methylobacterium dankookense TaxID=560405 RepID=UPI0011A60A66|nr:hypothetical protein [Methylobacterium dankookense]